ncbi:predicted protein [Sclerotinia sclerotiorum 1980 UF-70]|uniref:Uncharacterized protein n=1 Tax=Sclerotinia sclerotiorum (strain ATCC 18683 / 1980 / Ss-1) TaxID=665079 RepID=A7EZ88_SCLS1|nr:predicted protein [Sclerotinia sclerotiorum 1980 UF-70]EDN94780.1 predicted protein [Sclerotinia sclerotiorum 1980 UF-70]
MNVINYLDTDNLTRVGICRRHTGRYVPDLVHGYMEGLAGLIGAIQRGLLFGHVIGVYVTRSIWIWINSVTHHLGLVTFVAFCSATLSTSKELPLNTKIRL